jgi:hypothetical protein
MKLLMTVRDSERLSWASWASVEVTRDKAKLINHIHDHIIPSIDYISGGRNFPLVEFQDCACAPAFYKVLPVEYGMEDKPPIMKLPPHVKIVPGELVSYSTIQIEKCGVRWTAMPSHLPDDSAIIATTVTVSIDLFKEIGRR